MRTDPVVGNQKGLALVLTLLAISFLVAVTVQLMITIDRQVSLAAAQREQVRLDLQEFPAERSSGADPVGGQQPVFGAVRTGRKQFGKGELGHGDTSSCG